MERLKALGRGTQIMFIASVLLLIVSFFNWQEVDFDLGPLGEGSAGVSAWDNFLGIVMGILTIVLIARIVARMAAVDVPIPVSFAMTSVVLGVIIAICADPEEPHRRLLDVLELHRRRRSRSSSQSARGSRCRTQAAWSR